MPCSWTPTSERQMLLFAITKANLRPTSETWAAVALELGNGLTPSVVSQKYYKLRNESAATKSEASPSQATPKKRKRKSNDDPQTIRGECEEKDDLEVITVTPQLLIADRPYHKMHRVELEAHDRKAAQMTSNKTQKVKCEHVDDGDLGDLVS